MSDDESFLAAIRASPSDRTVRLVYADWLEERNDPRAELIRIEEEMRTLPVYSDRYWELKPRRNELREEFHADWLRDMRYHNAYPRPIFSHGVPDESAERWLLIRELLEQWNGIIVHDDEFENPKRRQGLLPIIQSGIGHLLPSSICEWIKIHITQNPQWVEQFLTANHTGDEPFILHWLQLSWDTMSLECQTRDLIHVDPPCYLRYPRLNYAPLNINTRTGSYDDTSYVGTLSEYAVEHFVSSVPNNNGFTYSIPITAELLANLQLHFGKPASVFTAQVYERDGVLIRMQSIEGWEEGIRLIVRTVPTITLTEIPAFLWDLAAQDRTATGLFANTATKSDSTRLS